MGFVLVQEGQIVPAENPAFGEKAGQARQLERRHLRGGKAALAGELQAAVAVQDLAAGHAYVLLGLEEIPHHLEGILVYEGVRIEEEQEILGGKGGSAVAARAEAEVAIGLEPDDFGIAGLEKGQGTVAGVVVEYDDLDGPGESLGGM